MRKLKPRRSGRDALNVSEESVESDSEEAEEETEGAKETGGEVEEVF
jgi:hypothetical protein